MVSRARSPAAARTPTCRMPPPTIFRTRRARATNSREPHTREPTGAASPLERQKVMESTGRAKSATGRPRATAALKMRAPSRCTATPWACAAVAVVRVLQADQAGGRDVDVGGANVLLHLGRGEKTTLRGYGHGLHAAEHRRARSLVVEDVGVAVEDDLLAVAGLGEHGDEIALRARGDEEGGLLARPAGRLFLQPPNGGIFLPHVVTHLGPGHRLSHGRGRKGQGVGAQIDDVVHGYLVAAVWMRWLARRPHSV